MTTYSKKKEKKITFIMQVSFLVVAFAGYFLTDSILGMVSTLFIWFGILILFMLIRKKNVQKLLDETGVGKVDYMDQKEFDQYLLNFFQEEGYKASHAPATNQANLFLKKENESIAIFTQPSNKVLDLFAIQKIIDILPKYKDYQIWVITNFQYNAAATGLALQNNITLLDREDLLERYLSLHSK